ncbi:MAG: STT3 domain-containing protein, partial [Elusimicrobiota bacterium]
MTPRYGILAALVLGLSVRLAPWSRVFAGGQAAFVDTDDYYHLRRMMVAAANFPALPAFDRYLGHPEGFFVNWPPLYDWVGGLFLRILVGATPDLYRSQIILAWIAPLCGLLTLWLFYRAVRPLLGPRPALTALFIAAVMPMQVFYTLLGRPDHHSVENLWFLLAVPLSLRLVRAEDPGLSRKLASWTGALLAAGTLCWIGDVMFSLSLFIFLAG